MSDLDLDGLLRNKPELEVSPEFEDLILQKVLQQQLNEENKANNNIVWVGLNTFLQTIFQVFNNSRVHPTLLLFGVTAVILIRFTPLQIPNTGEIDKNNLVSSVGDNIKIIADRRNSEELQINYKVNIFGHQKIIHTSGNAHYLSLSDVDFVIDSPLGHLEAKNASFQINIQNNNNNNNGGNMNIKSLTSGAILGSAITALSITVFAGEIELTDKDEKSIRIQSGEQYSAKNGLIQRKNDNVLSSSKYQNLKNEYDEQQKKLEAMIMAEANGENPLVQENESLKKRLAKVDIELESFEKERAASEGKAFDFPENIDSKYLKDELKNEIVRAFSKADLKADVKAVDCSEYPCLVHLQANIPGGESTKDTMSREKLEKMRAILEEKYPKSENSIGHHHHSSAIKKKNGTHIERHNIAFSVRPVNRDADEQYKELHKRTKFRVDEYLKTFEED